MLSPTSRPTTIFYQSPNQSMLQWLHQPLPGKTAWKKWDEIIRWLYTTCNDTTLSWPLGHWLPNYQTDFQWNWTICPTIKINYHQTEQHMHEYSPSHQTNTHITYPMVPRTQHHIPDNHYPITPVIKQGCILVALPIHETTHPAPQIQPELTPMQQLQSKPGNWEDPLWHQITKHGPFHTLSTMITLKKTIIITSNASITPTGQGTCTWILWSDSILWHGEGHVPGPPEELYSRLAKAYGLYTAIQFFQNYLNLFPLTLLPNLTIRLYCDNQGIVNQLNQTSTVTYPNDTIQDDYPIVNTIQTVFNSLALIKMSI